MYFVKTRCVVCRYAVSICGKEAIREALVTKSMDFADRPDFFTQRPKGIKMSGFYRATLC